MNIIIKEWCAKFVCQNSHMLEVLSPIDIVTAWEEYRQRVDVNVVDQLKNIQFRITCVEMVAEREHRELIAAQKEIKELKKASTND